MRSTLRLVFAVTTCTLVLCVSNAFIMVGNELAHYRQANAFLSGRIWIEKPSPPSSQLPRCRGYDAAVYRDRCYSNKPPGFALLATPIVWLNRVLSTAPELSPEQALTKLRLLNVLFIGLAATLLAAAAMRSAGQAAPGLSCALLARVGLTAGLGLSLGTLVLPYAVTATSHPISLLGFCVALYGLVRYRYGGGAGALLLGAAAIAVSPFWETKNAVLAVPLGLTLFAVARSGRHRLLVAGIAALLCALLLGYNTMLFGSPFKTAYSFYEPPPYVAWKASAAANFDQNPLLGLVRLLFHPGRGLLLYSPALLLSGLGLWWYAKQDRPLGIGLAAGIVAQFGFVSVYRMWHGGHCIGHRHLLPVLPVLVFALAPVVMRFRGYWLTLLKVLLVAGFLVNTAACIVQQSSVIWETWLAEPLDLHASLAQLFELWVVRLARGDVSLRCFFPYEWLILVKLGALAVLAWIASRGLQLHARMRKSERIPTIRSARRC
ncbi:MAG: hypothetical protein JW940_08990 [Polyangiaceae bacterium]|nr:hypothetical protein [Polyangiaceae bacterium]